MLRPTRPLLTSEPRIRSFPPVPRPPQSPLPNRRRFLQSPRPLPASTHGLLLLIVSNKLLRSRTLECSPAAAMSRTWSITFIPPRKAADSGGGSAKSWLELLGERVQNGGLTEVHRVYTRPRPQDNRQLLKCLRNNNNGNKSLRSSPAKFPVRWYSLGFICLFFSKSYIILSCNLS